jgi:hypothetical protein
MNVSQETLDSWPRTCERMRGVMVEVRSLLLDGNPDQAVELVEWAYIASIVLGNEIESAGGARPPRMNVPPDIPLRLLSSEANRRYARLLRQAHEAGAAVDEERGWGDTGPSQLLRMLLKDVDEQVFGPDGHGESALDQTVGGAEG